MEDREMGRHKDREVGRREAQYPASLCQHIPERSGVPM